MSAPGGGAPSPVPRGGSMGPGNNMNAQQPIPGGAPMHHQPPTPGPPPPSTGAMSQQNLNQISPFATKNPSSGDPQTPVDDAR
ncbi:WD40 repeat-like protein [Penicillium malachiteum]|uniref:WD40 repeat-like protein n=1 Tax=Penicillium malachiteum TaxID=1324776 RepID=UPI0025479040|nr:WD40 repeat-like protein [Penicillium malachiteum]KAJ5718882.1 WD40 repeat-like protein [Penicillium malachiteum]